MKHIKMYNEESGLVPVLFKSGGVDKISYYDSNKSLSEIKELIHKHDVYEQMSQDFKSHFNQNSDISKESNGSLGYALSLIKDKRYISRISDIRFGEGNYGNVKY